MSDATHIKDLLSPEEYAEHQQLVRRMQLLDLAQSDCPLSTRQVAELIGLSPATVQSIEMAAKHKLVQSLQTILAPSSN